MLVRKPLYNPTGGAEMHLSLGQASQSLAANVHQLSFWPPSFIFMKGKAGLSVLLKDTIAET